MRASTAPMTILPAAVSGSFNEGNSNIQRINQQFCHTAIHSSNAVSQQPCVKVQASWPHEPVPNSPSFLNFVFMYMQGPDITQRLNFPLSDYNYDEIMAGPEPPYGPRGVRGNKWGGGQKQPGSGGKKRARGASSEDEEGGEEDTEDGENDEGAAAAAGAAGALRAKGQGVQVPISPAAVGGAHVRGGASGAGEAAEEGRQRGAMLMQQPPPPQTELQQQQQPRQLGGQQLQLPHQPERAAASQQHDTGGAGNAPEHHHPEQQPQPAGPAAKPALLRPPQGVNVRANSTAPSRPCMEYRGVFYAPTDARWVVRVGLGHGRSVEVGRFGDQREAAREYDKHLLCTLGLVSGRAGVLGRHTGFVVRCCRWWVCVACGRWCGASPVHMAQLLPTASVVWAR